MIITAPTPDALPEIPDDYFPEANALGVLGTFKCPICASKAWVVVPYDHALVFDEILRGKSSDEEMSEALALLVKHVDEHMTYLSPEERLRVITGVCSMECELQWIDTLD